MSPKQDMIERQALPKVVTGLLITCTKAKML